MAKGKIRRSFELAGKSLSVLRKDKEMLLFPISSLILGILVTGIAVFLLYFSGSFQEIVHKKAEHVTVVWLYLGLFLYYLVIYFIGIFFNAALVKCVYIRLRGGNPTFSDGIKSSLQNIKAIFLWSLIASTVGIILNIIQDKFRRFGWVIGNIGQVAWSCAILFVVPVLIIEKESVINSIKKSAKIFVQRWGESVVGGIGIGIAAAIYLFAGLAVILLLCFLSHIPWIIGLCISLLHVFLTFLVSVTLNDIYTIALYNYATSGESTDIFSEDMLKNSFNPKPPSFYSGFRMPGFPGQEPGQI